MFYGGKLSLFRAASTWTSLGTRIFDRFPVARETTSLPKEWQEEGWKRNEEEK